MLLCRSPTFVTCSKIASGRAVLLGDAAHCISPNIGMGCQSALQDSDVLSHACVAANGDINASAKEYNARRLQNVHVLTHISRQLDVLETFRFHKNLLAAAIAIPYTLPQIVRRLSSIAPVPGVLPNSALP